jgi:CRISPR-associated protein Cst2
MSAEAAKTDGSDATKGEEGEAALSEEATGEPKGRASKAEARKPRPKGKATIRRSPLEITRAISLTPYGGDVTFNAASPGATPSAQKGEKGVKNPVPYGTEVHATRYQYGFALTPGALRKPERAATAIQAICALGEVAGNHGRFLYDFSPESVVFRITHDPAPRLLYIFDGPGSCVDAPALLDRVRYGDLLASELILGGALCSSETAREIASLGATLEPGVRNAARRACERIANVEG